ncbi:MAG TPA: type II toxin-antitoxin system RelE/ParE family toxin [Candidatus Krumholzibacteria bacterium]|nr:type II toxin-antitoxin system RelE/ParE family toxin [Candidatus Krumholzibacteria bacterium]
MAEIVWSPQSVEDVESIRDYMNRDSPHFAALVAQRIVDAVEHLGRFPESGRIVPEFGDPRLREVLWRNYRIVYRSSPTVVEIVTVFHGARLFVDSP